MIVEVNEQKEILKADGLYHVYESEAIDGNVVALRGIYMEIAKKEVVAVVGPSGAGKSTLLKCLGGLMKPSAGDVFLGGESIAKLDTAGLLELRQRTVSFIFQESNLLPYMNVVNNVALPLKYMKVNPRQARHRAMELLERLDIVEQARMLPSRVSGGEKQRVAIARALITKPRIILADEPTGSVDLITSREILRLFQELVEQENVSFLIVTHSSEVAEFADRSLELIDGRFVAEHGINIDVSNLSDTRRIIIDQTGNMTLPPGVLEMIGGPGVFELIRVREDEINMTRGTEDDCISASRTGGPVMFCRACGYGFGSASSDSCLKCGAIRSKTR